MPAAETSQRASVAEALQAIADEMRSESIPIRRVSISILESGQVAYRCHPADGGEYIGGVATVQASRRK